MGSSEMDAIPETGAVFTIGRSRFADNIASHFFIRKDPVVSVSCGDEHSAVICQSGRLFVFGSNNWGQLGLGHKSHVSKPSCVKILKPEKVTHVACGRAHTLICTGAQKIFACGSDQEGQLGRASSAIGDSASSPVLVYDCGLAGPRIVQIAAGSHHSLALTSDGGVVAWGSNLEGQLGQPGTSGLVNKPTKVHVPEPVKEISAGYYHSAFLTESGSVYICGESESGKLGIDVNFSTQAAPKQMQLPSPASHVACGGHHTVVLAENGNLYCAGSNASGQLGMGTSVTESQTPKLLRHGALRDETISRIACGESHTAVLTESGKLFTCGDGRHGKLGLEENENNVHELTFAPKYQELFVSNVACGGCHTILVARRRDSIGQGNHGGESDALGKKNPLPPLKLPVNRLQSESTEAKSDDKEKAEALSPKEPTSDTAEATTENHTAQSPAESSKSPDKNTTNNAPEGKPEDSKEKLSDEANQTKTTEHESSESVHKESSNESPVSPPASQDNEGKGPVENKESEEAKESAPVEVKSQTEENSLATEGKLEKEKARVDTENNVQHEAKTDTSPANESSEKRETKEDDEKAEKGIEAEKDTTTEIKASPEKRVSSGNTPPPKPPRLKPGSGSNSASERKPVQEEGKKSSPERAMKADLPEAATATSNMTVTEINMTNDRIEIVSIGNAEMENQKDSNEADKNESQSETTAGRTQSANLKSKADEIITNVKDSAMKEVNAVKESAMKEANAVKESALQEANAVKESALKEANAVKESAMKEVNALKESAMKEINAVKEGIDQIESKIETDAAEDDADVIQSPATKTGKMMKLFKPKKQEEIAKNGTKVAASNIKSKSKACSIL